MALRAKILTLPFSPMPAVAFPADVFSPGSAAFLAVGINSAQPRRYLLARGKNDRTGTVTISYVAPIGQNGAVYTEAGGLIAAHFPEELKLRFEDVCVRITDYPHVVDGYQDDGWWRTPVTIKWRVSA